MNVARAVEKELRGRNEGSELSKIASFRSGHGNQFRSNNLGSNTGSEWVYVKGNKEGPGVNGNSSHRGGSFGPNKAKHDPTEENKKMQQRDRGVSHLPYRELMERRQKGLL